MEDQSEGDYLNNQFIDMLVSLVSDEIYPYALNSSEISRLVKKYHSSLDEKILESYATYEEKADILDSILKENITTAVFRLFGDEIETTLLTEVRRKNVVLAENGKLGKYDQGLENLRFWGNENEKLISIAEKNLDYLEEWDFEDFFDLIVERYIHPDVYMRIVRDGLDAEQTTREIYYKSLPPIKRALSRKEEKIDALSDELELAIIEKYFDLIKDVVRRDLDEEM